MHSNESQCVSASSSAGVCADYTYTIMMYCAIDVFVVGTSLALVVLDLLNVRHLSLGASIPIDSHLLQDASLHRGKYLPLATWS